MNANTPNDSVPNAVEEEVPEIALTDEDILDAMRHISGYLDISTDDFRAIYHFAHQHAADRLVSGIRADRLMRKDVPVLRPDMPLAVAARIIAQSGYKSLPVVNDASGVVGMLTENDFLKRLKAGSFLGLLLKMLEDTFEFTHRCHETSVRDAMSSPAITVAGNSEFREIMHAFHRHSGRCMPVVADDGQLRGLLFRKDVLAAYGAQELS